MKFGVFKIAHKGFGICTWVAHFYCPQYTLTNKKAMQFLVVWLYPFISGVGRDWWWLN
jgi:hypothetical protein